MLPPQPVHGATTLPPPPAQEKHRAFDNPHALSSARKGERTLDTGPRRPAGLGRLSGVVVLDGATTLPPPPAQEKHRAFDNPHALSSARKGERTLDTGPRSACLQFVLRTLHRFHIRYL